jgi:hypothetical protein
MLLINCGPAAKITNEPSIDTLDCLHRCTGKQTPVHPGAEPGVGPPRLKPSPPTAGNSIKPLLTPRLLQQYLTIDKEEEEEERVDEPLLDFLAGFATKYTFTVASRR